MTHYETFFKKQSNYNGFFNNQSFQELFEWLSEPKQIADMMEACRFEHSALQGVIKQLEQRFSNRNDLFLQDNFTRRAVGAVIAFILSDFGYRPCAQRKVSKAMYFKTAAQFMFDEKRSVKKRLVMNPVIETIPFDTKQEKKNNVVTVTYAKKSN